GWWSVGARRGAARGAPGGPPRRWPPALWCHLPDSDTAIPRNPRRVDGTALGRSSPARPAGPLRAESEPGPEASPAPLSECSYFASVVNGLSAFIGECPITAPHTR